MYKTVVKIDGMMCEHCEASVNEALRAAFELDKVSSSHDKGETVIIAENPIELDAIKAALNELDLEAVSAQSEAYEKKGLFGSQGGAR